MKKLLLALSLFSFLSLTACMHGGKHCGSKCDQSKCADCKKDCADCKDKKHEGCDMKDEPKAEVKKEEPKAEAAKTEVKTEVKKDEKKKKK